MSIDPPELVDAGRIRGWLTWYFKQGAYTLITAPLFFIFAFALVTAIAGAILQAVALVRVSYAVLGWLGLLGLIFGAWIPVILPPALYFSLVKNLPGLWIRRDATRKTKIIISIGIVIALPLAAYLIFQGVALGIGWIADRNSCAALAAGVTGSVVPTNCQ